MAIDYQGKPGKGKEKFADPDYQRVDIDTSDNERSRSVGAEQVVNETIKSLNLDDLFTALEFNKPARDAAIGVIAARLIAPSSERATHLWLQDLTARDELLAADFTALSQDRGYKTSDLLLRHKKEIEDHL